MVFQRPPQQGLQQRVCLCSASPADPSGHREQGMTRVICPPGWPPAPAAILGASCQSSPGSQAQRASPHLSATCIALSLRHVPPCALAGQGGSVACAVGWSGTELALAAGTGCGCQAAGWAQSPAAAGAAHPSHGKSLVCRAIQR